MGLFGRNQKDDLGLLIDIVYPCIDNITVASRDDPAFGDRPHFASFVIAEELAICVLSIKIKKAKYLLELQELLQIPVLARHLDRYPREPYTTKTEAELLMNWNMISNATVMLSNIIIDSILADEPKGWQLLKGLLEQECYPAGTKTGNPETMAKVTNVVASMIGTVHENFR